MKKRFISILIFAYLVVSLSLTMGMVAMVAGDSGLAMPQHDCCLFELPHQGTTLLGVSSFSLLPAIVLAWVMAVHFFVAPLPFLTNVFRFERRFLRGG